MGKTKEFAAVFDADYEKSLPEEFLEKYHIIECLSTAEQRDTLLVQDKKSRKKRVAKCYFEYSADEENVLADLSPGPDVSHPKEEYRNAGCLCVLRDYVEGVTLAEYVKINGLTTARITDFALKLVHIMKQLHTSDPIIIHRDIKPENIIVREDESLVLIDFGISRIYKEEQSSDTVFSGTRNYAPPEQYGFMQTDVRSDMYSFGVVLSWMLTGKEAPVKAPKTKLERIAAKCCAFVPEQRYKNDTALLKALHRTTEAHAAQVRKIQKAACLFACAILLLLAGASACYHIRSAKASYSFREPLIEEAVRLSLNRPKGVIRKEELQEVTEIFIFTDQAYAGIDEYYEGQGKWYALDSRIHGTLCDLTDLKFMTNLRILYIGGNEIADLTPLRGLDRLEEVSLQDNAITDISALADKPVLREVSLLGNRLNDIEPVRTWPAIRCLNLSETGDYDGSPLEALKGIDLLDVFHGPNAAEHLNGLYTESLRVGWSSQTDLAFLSELSHVEKLWIDWSNIHDISALAGREDIVYLNMECCAIDDLSPLFTMPNLLSVEMSAREQAQMEALTETYGPPAFEIIYTK